MSSSSSSSFIVTGNKDFLSKKTQFYGIKNIAIKGKTIIKDNCILRGDLRKAGGGQTISILIGKSCFISQNAIIRPPSKLYKGAFSYYPIKIGDYVSIGENSIIQAAQIGNCVEIGKDCIVGPFTVIKDNAKILDGTILPPLTVVAPYSVFGTKHGDHYGSFLEPLSESWPDYCRDQRDTAYETHYACFH